MIGNKKKLSVITPLYNTPKSYLDDVLKCIGSYSGDVELVLVNDSPNDLILSKRLKCINQPYILKLQNEKNMGIFEAYMNGFLHASGEYCCILDHDDIFDPKCVLKAIKKKPDLIFTNEYKFFDGEDGKKIKGDVFIKPDFDLLSTIFYFYTHHVTVVKTEILQRQLKSYKGENTYTSVFDIHMMLEYMSAFVGREMNVIHIPEAPYGWRIHANSTAATLDQKLSGYFEKVKRVEEFLKKFGETPLLNIDKDIGYLVDGLFLSSCDMAKFPLKSDEFKNYLIKNGRFKGDEIEIKLQEGKYKDEDYDHFLKTLLKLPMKYLMAQNCLPILIPKPKDAVKIDELNMKYQIPNVPFLTKSQGDGSGLLISQVGKNYGKAKYCVLIK